MKKGPKWATKKNKFFKIAKSQIFFQKFQRYALGLVQLIDAKGIDVAQTGKKCIFGVLGCFGTYAALPLNHIG